MAYYGTVADADAYHLAHGNALWTGTADAKEAALTRASAYIDSRGRYQPKCGPSRSLFSGVKTGGRAQALAWPRTGATDADGNAIAPDEIPSEVEQAVYEAALRELIAPGSLLPDYVASRVVKRQKVDVIEREFAVSADGGAANVVPVVTIIENLLAPLLVGTYCDVGVFVV